MKSDFEKQAVQEAVEAVERRWQRGQNLARRGRRNRGVGCFAVVLALALAGIGITLCLFRREVEARLAPCLAAWRESESAVRVRCEYGKALRQLLTGEVRLSPEMPDGFKIRNAPPGVGYHVLTASADGWFGLYELVRDGAGELRVSELSPVSDARAVTAADMRQACGGRPYLVSVRGGVYLFGSRNLADATHLRSRVRTGCDLDPLKK